MKAIYLRQQKQGGIIDLEAEKNKYLIETKVSVCTKYMLVLVASWSDFLHEDSDLLVSVFRYNAH